MKKALFKKLADLEIQKRQLDDIIAGVRKQVSDEMKKEGADKIEAEYGSFFFQNRKTWTYSPAVKEAEADLKEMKKQEETDEIATCEITQSLVYKPAKASALTE